MTAVAIPERWWGEREDEKKKRVGGCVKQLWGAVDHTHSIEPPSNTPKAEQERKEEQRLACRFILASDSALRITASSWRTVTGMAGMSEPSAPAARLLCERVKAWFSWEVRRGGKGGAAAAKQWCSVGSACATPGALLVRWSELQHRSVCNKRRACTAANASPPPAAPRTRWPAAAPRARGCAARTTGSGRRRRSLLLERRSPAYGGHALAAADDRFARDPAAR